jgi:hypothetical protein
MPIFDVISLKLLPKHHNYIILEFFLNVCFSTKLLEFIIVDTLFAWVEA